MYKRGDIYLARINYDQTGQPVERPIIIISSDNINVYEDSIIGCSLTTSIQTSQHFLKLNGLKYGLSKDAFILPNRILSLKKTFLLKKLSHLTDSDMEGLDKYLLEVQGISKNEHLKTNESVDIPTFKELYVSGNQEYLEVLKKEIIKMLSIDEHRFIKENKEFPNFIIVTYQGVPKIADSIIYFSTGTNEYKITNIIPTLKSKLDFNEYNSIVDDFYSTVINPLVLNNNLKLSIRKTSGIVTVEDLLNQEVAGKLKLFSSAANKSTGISHPLDRERWLDFVSSSFRAKNIIDLDYLGRWLVEIEGWPDEFANELVLNYEYSIDLLSFYEEIDGNE